MPDLKTEYLGLTLKNPLIVGSSGLTDSVDKIKKLASNNAAAVVLKSVFEEQILMEMAGRENKDYHDYPEAHDYVRYYTREKHLNDYLKLIEEAKQSVDIPVIASINCITASEWIDFVKRVESAGADAVEVNVSLLPSDPNLSSEVNEQRYFEIVELVRRNTTIPIALKMSPYSAGLASLIRKLSWSKNIDSLVLFNRYYSPDIDLETMRVTAANVLSSPDELFGSLRWVALLSEQVDVPIVTSTGVHDGAAVAKQLLAGAAAVQIVSAIYKHGPEYLNAILAELEQWMERKGYSTPADFRGVMAYDKAQNGAAYERVQFMKYYGGLDTHE